MNCTCKWKKVQGVNYAHKKSISKNRNFNREFVLSGILRCPSCGAGMVMHKTKKRDGSGYHLYYMCETFHSMEVKSFFEEIYKELINYKLKGAIAISSIDGLDSYTSVDLKRNKVFEYHLLGLSYIDTLEIFRKINKNYHEEDFSFFYKLVGGYPVSINLLRELLSEDSITIEELTELQELTLESSNKHLFQKVFTTLAKEEQEIALSASIFSYPFKEEEISQILKSQLNPKYTLEHLKKKNIILEKRGYYDVHDSIRTLLIDIVSKDRKKELHQIMENFYKDYMEKHYEEFNDVLYDDIFRWGYHLEFLEDSEVISPKCSELLRLKEDQLDALWAIERFGYPFAYDDPELEYSSSIIEELKKKDLIISNNDDAIKNMLNVKEFVLNNFDLFDSFFLHHLCITRDISNHLGYIERFEPNDAFIRQGIICHWEHCIEYMPLENNRNENSCPVFGHNCPSGKEQVIICKEFTN